MLKVSSDGNAAMKFDLPWPTVAGRFRACEMSADGNPCVALEDQGKNIRVKPQ